MQNDLVSKERIACPFHEDTLHKDKDSTWGTATPVPCVKHFLCCLSIICWKRESIFLLSTFWNPKTLKVFYIYAFYFEMVKFQYALQLGGSDKSEWYFQIPETHYCCYWSIFTLIFAFNVIYVLTLFYKVMFWI